MILDSCRHAISHTRQIAITCYTGEILLSIDPDDCRTAGVPLTRPPVLLRIIKAAAGHKHRLIVILIPVLVTERRIGMAAVDKNAVLKHAAHLMIHRRRAAILNKRRLKTRLGTKLTLLVISESDKRQRHAGICRFQSQPWRKHRNRACDRRINRHGQADHSNIMEKGIGIVRCVLIIPISLVPHDRCHIIKYLLCFVFFAADAYFCITVARVIRIFFPIHDFLRHTMRRSNDILGMNKRPCTIKLIVIGT